jgi:hypothetical protein
MSNGALAILYSNDADATRAKLARCWGPGRWMRGGWLIFAFPPAGIAVYPAEAGGRAEQCLLCDDVAAPGTALQATRLRWPNRSATRVGVCSPPSSSGAGGRVGLYQPHTRPQHSRAERTALSFTSSVYK